jgi:hypothetical protein
MIDVRCTYVCIDALDLCKTGVLSGEKSFVVIILASGSQKSSSPKSRMSATSAIVYTVTQHSGGRSIEDNRPAYQNRLKGCLSDMILF